MVFSLLKPSTPRAIHSLVFTQKSFAFEMAHPPFQQSHSIIFSILILQLLCLIGCYLLDFLPDYQATLPDFLLPQLRLHEPFLLPNAASRLSNLVLLSSCYICLANPRLGWTWMPVFSMSATRAHCNLFNNGWT